VPANLQVIGDDYWLDREAQASLGGLDHRAALSTPVAGRSGQPASCDSIAAKRDKILTNGITNCWASSNQQRNGVIS
jgi:hypothetical protein